MFGSKKTAVVYIKEKTLRVGNVSLGKPKIENDQDYSWTRENLDTIISQAIKNCKTDTFRLLLDESVCQVVYNSLNEGNFEKDKIKEKIEEITGQKIDKTIWGFKYVQIAKDIPKGIQSVIISPSFLQNAFPGFSKSKIKIETIEPLSIALARLCAEENFPYIIIHSSSPTTVISAIKDVVLTSNTFEEKFKIDDLKKIYNYTKENYMTPGKIIVSSFPDMLNINDLKVENMEIENKEMDPLIGIALKKPRRVEEDIILNITLFEKMIRNKEAGEENKKENKETEKADNQKEPKNITEKEPMPIEEQIFAEPENKRSKIPTLLFILFIITVISGLGYFAFTKTTLTKKLNQISIPIISKPTPIPTNTPAPKPSPTPTKIKNLDKKGLKIKILNGSGIKGLASKVAESLIDLDYNEPETGNADSYDFETTIIEAKESKEDYIEILQEDLKDYSTNPDIKLTLDEENDFDILITIGKN
ncbi:LytR family transcriptional regulator [Candidatus Parcubacteria bacterium]|nr:MAG: LytR family transcriptional regulator [Candidatus Parcubacteria bacterium]